MTAQSCTCSIDGLVPETDTTVTCQSSHTKVFASGFSFQDVCGELIRVGQNILLRDLLYL